MIQTQNRPILAPSLSALALLFLPLLAGLGVFSVERSLHAKNSSSSDNPKMTAESIKSGEAVFFEYCSGCHGRRGDGRGPQSLNLKPKPQNLRNAQFVKYLTDDRMYSSISGGVRGTSMQAFEMMLSAEKRWNVIHYIRSLTADGTLNLPNSIAYQAVAPDVVNPILLTDASLSTGRRIFRNYCANCHGAAADGNSLLAPNLIPAPRNLVAVTLWGEKPFIDYLSDARLYDSITNGVPGTSMLPWIGVLTDEERWHIVNFLRSEAKSQREKGDTFYK